MMRTTKPLADWARATFPTWHVVDDTRRLDGVSRPTIVLWPERLQRRSQAGPNLAVTVDIHAAILTPKTAPGEIEADLDALLFEFLQELEDTPAYAWDTAQRGALEGAGQSWDLTITNGFITERN